jgi:RimJ/RimL family protein N-acetyltransferase
MRREGHLRQNAFIKDEWVDSVVFGALAAEWLHPSDLDEWDTTA